MGKNNSKILSDAVKAEEKAQSESLVIDFDQAIEEEKSKAITIKWEGKEYKVPGSPPQWIWNMWLRNDGVFSDDDHKEIFHRLFGKEFSEKLEKQINEDNWTNLSMATQKIIAPLYSKWFGLPVEDTTKKKSTPKSSSGRGGKSKRTSKGTTE